MTTELSAAELSRDRLLEILPRDSRVYGVIRRVSTSGMTRWIDFFAIRDNQLNYLTGHIANVLPGYMRTREGLKVEGTGMDMIFAVVSDLADELYDDTYALKHDQI